MKYNTIKEYGTNKFRRLTGVKRSTFEKMLDILKKAEANKKSRGGKPNTISMEDRLLMMLEYNREYGTYFHVGSSYGLSESAYYRNIRWIEDTLVKHPDFALPGRKALVSQEAGEYQLVTIDSTETPVERPKKSRNFFTLAKRKGTPSRGSLLLIS
jgi:hypothetical protein